MILRVVASPHATAVVDEGGVKPDGFLLAQNYPNPFNAETVIRYNIGRKGAVALSVFNLAGQQVRRLVLEARTPGFYQIAWDGRDDRGKEIASGVYIYRLHVGDLAEARKLLLLR